MLRLLLILGLAPINTNSSQYKHRLYKLHRLEKTRDGPRTMQAVVDIIVLGDRGAISAVTETQNHLEIRYVHTSRQLSAPVSSLKEKKHTHTNGFMYY